MRQMLLDLWGDDSFFNQRSLHVFITKLRHKLAKDERIRIVNVRGIGYKLIVDTTTLKRIRRKPAHLDANVQSHFSVRYFQ